VLDEQETGFKHNHFFVLIYFGLAVLPHTSTAVIVAMFQDRKKLDPSMLWHSVGAQQVN